MLLYPGCSAKANWSKMSRIHFKGQHHQSGCQWPLKNMDSITSNVIIRSTTSARMSTSSHTPWRIRSSLWQLWCSRSLTHSFLYDFRFDSKLKYGWFPLPTCSSEGEKVIPSSAPRTEKIPYAVGRQHGEQGIGFRKKLNMSLCAILRRGTAKEGVV
jgi:hypothetical protein